MTNLTEKQYLVLNAFPRAYGDDWEATASDLGSTWTDVKELAEETGLSVRAVRGHIGNLTKLGLVAPDEGADGNRAQCLTEAGVAVLKAAAEAEGYRADAEEEAARGEATPTLQFHDDAQHEADSAHIGPNGEQLPDAAPTEAEDEEEAGEDVVREHLAQEFARAFAAQGGHAPRGRCKALRAMAQYWDGTRKEFIQAAVDNGIMASTANANYQAGYK